jgi:hypothetical protein
MNGDEHFFMYGELEVYDALTLRNLNTLVLMNPVTQQPDRAMKFTAPLVVNGRVYVATMSGQILVYSRNGQ